MRATLQPIMTVLLVLLVAAWAIPAGTAAARERARTGDPFDPDLGTVPALAHTTTGKTPPATVLFAAERTGRRAGGRTVYAPGPGEVVVPGVPAYFWRDGCGPTAVGMVVGYYDGQGYGELIPGDAQTQTADVDQAIASHGTATAPRHYEDYAVPQETTVGELLADRSALPAGDEHASDCIADFLHTSRSADGLQYGSTATGAAASGFVGYVTSKYPGSTPAATGYSGSALTWTIVKGELDAGRPMVLLVDSSGDGRLDHMVAAIGYREINGYPEYACWDTWSTSTVRWQRFRAMSSTYAWGVWGGFAFTMAAQAPAPDPAPAADSTAPVTTASGLDDAWHNTGVTVSFLASDGGSGVAYTEYSVNGGGWVKATSVTFPVAKRTPTGVVYDLAFRSVDAAGNVEATKTGKVRLDTIAPVTTSNADTLTHKGPYTLVLSASDAHAGVRTTLYSVDGGAFVAGATVTLTTAGRHTVKFYSTDNAGNTESVRSATVRIS